MTSHYKKEAKHMDKMDKACETKACKDAKEMMGSMMKKHEKEMHSKKMPMKKGM